MIKQRGTHTAVEAYQTGDREHELYRFDNGYGASVVRHPGSYGGSRGLWELATIVWQDEVDKVTHGKYRTIKVRQINTTDATIGCLTDEDVEALLTKIAALGKRI